MPKLTTSQRNRAIKMLHGVLISDVYRDCFPPSQYNKLQGKSEEELLHFTLHAWRIDKPVSENAYNILCRLIGKDEVDKDIF